ncbi:hypothetical protein WJX82_003469 [Trebouxia sp. C0006]
MAPGLITGERSQKLPLQQGLINEDDPALKALVEEFFRGEGTGTTTAFADHPFHKLSSNIEVQTQAVLQLGKAINSCINDTRNGLLLAKPIEEAFHAGFLCFILGEDGEHRVHLLDARLWKVKLTNTKAYPWLKPPGQERMAKESKQQDVMKDVTEALKETLSQGRISPSAVPEIDASAWSHNSCLERIKDYLADPEFQYQVGPIDHLDSISELGKLDDSG